ncbi:YdeI/OmpD-associated family protein [Ottowia thiooxydans]|uniref:YdeI/OmpD-associated family protein n=1 Tax=Ottowia thiooxydans TaxID=219182 RepID=UPI0004904BDE|nr:YdeI/OmpD-associated family protein [Ottowia thiooxydans]
MKNPIFFHTPLDFRSWLTANRATALELTVGFHKVATNTPCMTWSESVDEALCFGWIDGVRRRIDDLSYSIRFTPRKPGSIWSAVNMAKMARLEAEGRITAAGAAAYARRTAAKSAVYSHEQESIAELRPGELAAFRRNQAGWTFFETTPAGYRMRVLHWVTTAKRDDTRDGRLAKLMEACAQGARLPQFK